MDYSDWSRGVGRVPAVIQSRVKENITTRYTLHETSPRHL